nr:hypothetical protein [uncultured Devosia sp.]
MRWDGWFVEHGFAENQQAAADRAIAARWKWIQTDIPRDIELEVAMFAARVMIMRVPNSLFAEKRRFSIWSCGISRKCIGPKSKATRPPKANNLMEQLSVELSRRRVAGEEIGEPKPKCLAIPCAGSGGNRQAGHQMLSRPLQHIVAGLQNSRPVAQVWVPAKVVKNHMC